MTRLLFYGFSPVLPVVLILFLLITGLFSAWWSYRDNIKEERNFGFIVLLLLRSLTFLSLALLLFNPYLIVEDKENLLPQVSFYIDNSQSMTIERGNYKGESEYSEIIGNIFSITQDQFTLRPYIFDESVRDTVPDFSGNATNLNLVMEHIREHSSGLAAVILLTDGIPTIGRNPLFTAQHLSVPAVVFAAGDTTDVKDIALTDVTYNPLSYINTRQTVSVEILHEGFSEQTATLNLIQNGEIRESRQLDFTTERGSIMQQFFLEFEDPGFYEFEFNIPALEGELTELNNSSAFTIEVLDNKTKIHSVAFEVHPDVSTIRRIISSDIQNELIVTNYLSDSQITGPNPLTGSVDPDLLILHGLPEQNSEISEWIFTREIPILYFSLPLSFYRQENRQLSNLLGYFSDSVRNPSFFEIERNSVSESHPVLENLELPARFPRLNGFSANYRLSPLSVPLMNLTAERVQTEQAVLILNETPNHKSASVTTYGWNRYARDSDPVTRTFFTQLLTNLVSWTAAPSDDRNLILTPQRDHFAETDNVLIRAALFNDLAEPEEDALIQIRVFQGEESDPVQQYRMSHLRDEFYEVSLGTFPQGIYRIVAEALKNDRVTATEESRFHVASSNSEFINTRRNDELMRQIAEMTDGIFISDGTLDEMIGFLETVTANYSSEVSRYYSHLHRNLIWFFIVLLLLSAEWFIRKRMSLQ
ncbi:MAG: hypothetical protein EA360_07635 [Balneolaceae bacterium]|nr:MAG: hypothetical protein EA360_07635 [Balneolaceae bacterium]